MECQTDGRGNNREGRDGRGLKDGLEQKGHIMKKGKGTILVDCGGECMEDDVIGFCYLLSKWRGFRRKGDIWSCIVIALLSAKEDKQVYVHSKRMSISVCICLSFCMCLSVCVSVCICLSVSICLYMSVSVYLSVCLSVCLCVLLAG